MDIVSLGGQLTSLIPTIIFGFIAILGIWYLTYSLRVELRYRYRNYRESKAGEMKWVKLSVQQRPVEGRNDSSSTLEARETNLIRSLSKSISLDSRDKAGRVARPVVSFVWIKDDKKNLTLYAGITSSHFDKLREFASSLNFKASAIKGTPPIQEGTLSVAHRNYRDIPENVAEIPVKLGGVVSYLGTDSVGPSSIILTLETARNSERARYSRNMAESKLMRQGDTGSYGAATTKPADIASADLMRTSMGAIVAGGDMQDSTDLLKGVTSKITTLASDANGRDIISSQRIWTIPVALATVTGILGLVWLGGLTTSAGVALGALFITGLLASIFSVGNDKIYSRAYEGELVVPNFWYVSARYYLVGAFNSRRTNGAGGEAVGNRIAPPSIPQVIHFYPAPLAEFVTPPIDSSGALDVSSERVAKANLPTMMTNFSKYDIPLGLSYYKNQPAVLPLDTIELGMAVFGAPQSGKTNFLSNVWTSLVAASYGRYAGLDITPIWMETKGEGAYDAMMLAETICKASRARGENVEDPLLLEAHNDMSAFRIAMEGKRISEEGNTTEDVIADINRFYGALQYAFGDAIQYRSAEFMLNALLVAGLLLPEENEKIFNLNQDEEQIVDPYAPNMIVSSWRILGGDNANLPVGKHLLAMEESINSDYQASLRKWREAGQPQRTPEEHKEGFRIKNLLQSIRILKPLLSGERNAVSDSAAPKNKLSPFLAATSLFSPSVDKSDITPEQILYSRSPVILNFGPYSYTDEWGEKRTKRVLSDDISRTLGLMFNYTLWSTVKNIGSGWGRAGKRITFFADEVADLANDSSGTNNNTFADALKEGRSRGFSYFCAAQNPGQIPESAREPMMGIRTKFFFQMPNADDAQLVIHQLGAEDGEFKIRHITDLPQGVAAGRIYTRQIMGNPFSMKTPAMHMWANVVSKKQYPTAALQVYQVSEARKDNNA